MDPEFRSLVYYGTGRQARQSELETSHAVITTYNVVASEWKTRKRAGNSHAVPPHQEGFS